MASLINLVTDAVVMLAVQRWIQVAMLAPLIQYPIIYAAESRMTPGQWAFLGSLPPFLYPRWLSRTGLRLIGGVKPAKLLEMLGFFQLSFPHIMQHYGLLGEWFGLGQKKPLTDAKACPVFFLFQSGAYPPPNAQGTRAPGLEHRTKLIGPSPAIPILTFSFSRSGKRA